MSTTVSMEVLGLKEALREIQSIDKKARRKITSDYKQITKPVVTAARQRIPQQAPLSGWNRTWKPSSNFQALPWQSAIANSMISQKVSGKKPREWAGRTTNLAVFTVAWKGAINTIYDLAGRGGNGDTERGAQMIRALEARFGKASRVLWPAYEMNREQVEKQVGQLVEDVLRQVNRKLA
jgi:hypothetical protein